MAGLSLESLSSWKPYRGKSNTTNKWQKKPYKSQVFKLWPEGGPWSMPLCCPSSEPLLPGAPQSQPLQPETSPASEAPSQPQPRPDLPLPPAWPLDPSHLLCSTALPTICWAPCLPRGLHWGLVFQQGVVVSTVHSQCLEQGLAFQVDLKDLWKWTTEWISLPSKIIIFFHFGSRALHRAIWLS